MTNINSIVLFKEKEIRRIWDNEKEDWFYSIVDIIGVLSDSSNPRRYWNDLKTKLKEEGSQVSDIIVQLKLKAQDGKFRETDVGDTKTILRLIQSIPSKKAEPFKIWLSQVGKERLDETIDPEILFNRAFKNYLNLGKSKEWINQRLKSIEIRKDLTDEWERSGVKEGFEFAVLTDIITKEWSNMTTKEYKNFKGLKKENLRDNFSNMELVLNMLGEVSTTEISKKENPKTFEESKRVAKKGGEIAGNARKEIERKTNNKKIDK